VATGTPIIWFGLTQAQEARAGFDELLRPEENMRSAAATGSFIPAHRERSAPRLPPDLLG